MLSRSSLLLSACSSGRQEAIASNFLLLSVFSLIGAMPRRVGRLAHMQKLLFLALFTARLACGVCSGPQSECIACLRTRRGVLGLRRLCVLSACTTTSPIVWQLSE